MLLVTAETLNETSGIIMLSFQLPARIAMSLCGNVNSSVVRYALKKLVIPANSRNYC